MLKKIQKIFLYLIFYIAIIGSLRYIYLRILVIMPFYLDIINFSKGVNEYVDDSYLAEYPYGEEAGKDLSVNILTYNNYIKNYKILNEKGGDFALKLPTDKIVSLNSAVAWQYFEFDNVGNILNEKQKGHPGFQFIGRIRKNSVRLLKLLLIFKQKEIKIKYSDENEDFKVIFLQPTEEFWPNDPRKNKDSPIYKKLEKLNINYEDTLDPMHK